MTELAHGLGSGRFIVGDLTVDLDRHEVSRGNQPLAVPKLSFKLFVALIAASPSVLRFDELVEEVWDGRPVTDETIHQRIRLLRKALDDDANNPAYIGLVRGEGYRLLPGARSAQMLPEGQRRPTVRMRVLGPAIFAILITAGVVYWWMAALEHDFPVNSDATSVIFNKSVAVLPFADMSPGGDQQYFADGIAEELLDELTRLEGLRVANRTSSFAYGNSGGDIRSIASALNVATVLQGSVRKSGDRIRVTAQLSDAGSGFHLWSRTFERDLREIFVIQDEIAEAVAGALGVSLDVGGINAFTGAGTRNVEAYEAYLRATQLYLPRQPDERIRLLERAVELDPDYAAAWASLGLTIAASMWISPVEEAPEILSRAIPIVHRAVQLDPDSSFANDMLATVNYATMDWIRSEEYFAKAFEIGPDGETFANYANMMMRSGRSKRALRYQELAARAERNPVGTPVNFNAALALGHMDSADRRPVNFAGISPAVSDVLQALNSSDSGKLRTALKGVSPSDEGLYELAQTILPNFDSQPEVLSAIEALYISSDAQWPAKYHDSALLAAFFGDPEFALKAISHEARLTTIRYGALWYPVMSEVRELPGFVRLMTDVNLVAYWRAHGWPDHCRPKGSEDFECF